MKMIFLCFICVILMLTSPGQGVTRHGEVSKTNEEFIDQSGQMKKTPHIDQYGRILDGAYGFFTDSRNKQTYKWVKVGDQVWMAENLNFTSANSWCYNNIASNCDHYGRLYTWDAVMNGASSSSTNPSRVRGVCPTGWHVPCDNEWTELVSYIVNKGYPNIWNAPDGVSNALKSCRQVGSPLDSCNTNEHPRWNSHGTHRSYDAFGFSAFPGGLRSAHGSYFFIGYLGYWWSATESSTTDAFARFMDYGYGDVYRFYGDKADGFNLRCVRD